MNKKLLTKELVKRLLREEHLMKPGESDSFTHIINQREWHITLKMLSRKEAPNKYILTAESTDGNAFTRCYKTMDEALLHIFNDLNDHKMILNRYHHIVEIF